MSKYDELKEFIDSLNDDDIWRPFFNDATFLKDFETRILTIRESKGWPKSRNKEKGTLLEEFVRLIFSRFSIIKTIQHDQHTADNEVDLYVHLNDVLPFWFINLAKGQIICECKNVWSSSINVGTVTKLYELCQSKHAGLGIFISILGISGEGWKFGEGKRRKLYIKDEMPIISFTLDELENLKYEGNNFYTMIIGKYHQLIDEAEFVGGELRNIPNTKDFVETLLENLRWYREFDFVTLEQCTEIKDKIAKKYAVELSE